MWHILPSYLKRSTRFALVVLVTLAVGAGLTRAAEGAQPLPKEREFIAVLQSDAAPGDKAIACKRLAIVGSPAAVPALAPLLADEELASWARIALEAIPGPEADEALRGAMQRVQGLLLVGVIHSMGHRRDTLAVEGLTTQLNQTDPDVVSAAGVALGRIGGAAAAQALESALTRVSAAARSEVAEGCIICAEGFLAAGNTTEAARLYDRVRQTSVFKPRVLESTRGAILARGTDGLPLLIEQLRSDDKDFLSVGLRTARELPGLTVTEALVSEVRQASPERRGLVLMAVGDREDSAVLPAVTRMATEGDPDVRMVAVGILERRGGLDSLPTLLQAATDENSQLAESAQLSLARFGGADVDAQLVARLGAADGKLLEVLIELVGLRGIEAGVPKIVSAVASTDPEIRRAAVTTVGALGTTRQIAALVPLVKEGLPPRERSDLEKALVSIAGREGAASTSALMPLLNSEGRTARTVGLHALAAAGGSTALEAVMKAVKDSDEQVQDEAVRTLASWPNTWPGDEGAAEPLLALARSGDKAAHRIQGLRGYLQYLREDRALGSAGKMAALEGVMSMVERPEEQRLAISVLGTIPTAEALELLIRFTADAATVEEACQAIVNIAAGPQLGADAADIRRKALQAVVDRTDNDRTRRRARTLL